jgi:transposase-like protein
VPSVRFTAAGAIGAGRYERTDDRVTERDGTRPKLLATKAGDVELRIPSSARARSSPAFSSPGAALSLWQ